MFNKFGNLRWHPLAEFSFCLHENVTEDNSIYCLCSRVLIRDINHYHDFSKNDEDVITIEQSDEMAAPIQECEIDESKGMFLNEEEAITTNNGYQKIIDTSYCKGTNLNNSNMKSGNNEEIINEEVEENTDLHINDEQQGVSSENYLHYDSWQSFWHDNGERIIWSSWLEKYGEYVDPNYIDEYKDIANKVDLTNKSIEDECVKDESVRRRKYSFDSKINSLKTNTNVLERKRSTSEHEQLASFPDNFDSLTNVTKMTMSSCDVLSESGSSNSYASADSSSSFDETEIFRDCNDEETETNDLYWQKLWWEHFDEQNTVHFANYNEAHLNYISQFIKLPEIEINAVSDEFKDKVDSLKLSDIGEEINKIQVAQPKKKRNRKKRDTSLAILVNDLKNGSKVGDKRQNKDENQTNSSENNSQSNSNNLNVSLEITGSSDGGDEDPPEERPVTIKRRHEEDVEENPSPVQETMNAMGMSYDSKSMPQSELIYRKRMAFLLIPKKPASLQQFNTNTYENDCQEVDEDAQNELDQEEKQETGAKEENEDNIRTSNNDDLSDVEDKVLDAPHNRRKRNKRPIEYPPEIQQDKTLKKYWRKRHSLFSKFDYGIRLDRESWFSATPEQVACHIAERCRCDLIVDAFCGAAGNTIQFANVCERVIAIDIDPDKIELARNNAKIYGVEDRIEFIVGDFFEIAPTLKADVVFLSPPWGGPQYAKESYDVETMLQPFPASKLLEAARLATDNVALYVPRTSRSDQLVRLAGDGGFVEIEQNFLDRRFVALTAYYGELVREWK